VLAYVVAGVCLFVGIMVDARTVALQVATAGANVMPPLGFWWAILGAVLCAGGGYLLQKLTRLFYVYEFEHAHND